MLLQSLLLLGQHLLVILADLAAGGGRTKVLVQALAAPSRLDDQGLLIVFFTDCVAKLEFRANASWAAITNSEITLSVEKLNLDIFTFNPIAVLMQVIKEIRCLRQGDLVLKQGNFSFPFHVRLTSKDKDLHRIRRCGSEVKGC